MNIKHTIDATEKLFLVVIAGFTVIAMGQEIMLLVENRKVALQDLLLMFIYAEVLGMLGAFYSRQRNLIVLPLFIAMTALSRLIILQGKEADPVVLLYESGAILLIAVACWVVGRMRTIDCAVPPFEDPQGADGAGWRGVARGGAAMPRQPRSANQRCQECFLRLLEQALQQRRLETPLQ